MPKDYSSCIGYGSITSHSLGKSDGNESYANNMQQEYPFVFIKDISRGISAVFGKLPA